MEALQEPVASGTPVCLQPPDPMQTVHELQTEAAAHLELGFSLSCTLGCPGQQPTPKPLRPPWAQAQLSSAPLIISERYCATTLRGHCLAHPAWRLAWGKGRQEAARYTSPVPLTLFLEDSPLHKFKGQEDRALLLQAGGVGGHGAWCDAPNVCMVPTAGHIEHRPCLTRPKHLGVRTTVSGTGGPPPQVPGQCPSPV